jgi:hypothetical protein
MFVYAPALALLMWGMFRTAADYVVDGWTLIFLAGLYFLGAGMGMHDTCDLLGRVYRSLKSPALHRSFDFFDNRLGHWVFFVGFVLTSVANGVAQLRHPLEQPMAKRWLLVFLVLSLPLAAVMVTNLMFERTGVDLAVISFALLVVVGVHVFRGGRLNRAPLLLVYYPAYAAAVIGPLMYWALRGYAGGRR